VTTLSERFVQIYRRRSDGAIFVQAFWNKPTGGATVQGNPQALGPSASDTKLTQAIIYGLERFSRAYVPEKARRLPEWSSAVLGDKYDVVFIEEWPNGEILVGPMRKVPGGFEGTKKTVRLSAASSDSDLASAIRKALMQAGTV
jgi:hypothetical protein